MEHIEGKESASIFENSKKSLEKKKSGIVIPVLPVPQGPPSLKRSLSWRDLTDSPKSLLKEISSQFSPRTPKSWTNFEKIPPLTGPYIVKKPSKEIAKTAGDLVHQRRTDLSKRIEGKTGYPWEDIANLGDVDQVEVLLDLYTLSLKAYDQSSTAEFILMETLNLIQKNQKEPIPGLDMGALPFVGMLIDYISTDPSGLSKLMNGKNTQEIVEKVTARFKLRLQNVQEGLKKLQMAYQEAGLQNGEMACIKQIPVEIAKLLIPAEGLINIGIINLVKEAFVKDQAPLNYQINLVYGLTHLRNKPELRNVISQIKKPRKERNPASIVIRASQNLSLNETVNNMHAQRTALSAILSHLRQLPTEDSCFTTSIAIELMSFNLYCCAKDFSEILESSKLVRMVNKVNVDFPFVVRMAGESLETTIKFDRDGRLVDGTGKRLCYIWDAPGIRLACQSIGWDDPKIVIKKLFLGQKMKINSITAINLRDFFRVVAKESSKNFELSESELINQASFTYDSLTTCHPLLRVWENSLAGMAEAQKTSIMKTAIVDSVLKVFQDYAQLVAPSLNWKGSEFEKMVMQEIYTRGFPQYDPEIGKSDPEGSQFARGAFVLYEQTPTQNSLKRMRVDSGELYQNFIKIVLESVICKIPKSERVGKSHYIDFLKGLVNYVQGEHFVASNLEHYHEENRRLIERLEDFDRFRYTPWITRIGNNPKTVLEVYYEIEKLPEIEVIRPKAEIDLLRKFVNIRRNSTPRTKETLSHNPYYLQPVRRPGMHAFSTLGGELAIPPEMTTDQWIETTILKPGREIAYSPMNPVQKDEMIKFVLQRFSNSLNIHVIDKTIKHLSTNTSIKEFRDLIISTLSKIESKNTLFNTEFERELDTKIYLTLPKDLKTKLENTALHVADSNMPNGTKDIRYCFAVNPGTGELAFWACLDDKPLIAVLDAKLWLLNQSWEFYRHPQNANESPRLT